MECIPDVWTDSPSSGLEEKPLYVLVYYIIVKTHESCDDAALSIPGVRFRTPNLIEGTRVGAVSPRGVLG